MRSRSQTRLERFERGPVVPGLLSSAALRCCPGTDEARHATLEIDGFDLIETGLIGIMFLACPFAEGGGLFLKRFAIAGRS